MGILALGSSTLNQTPLHENESRSSRLISSSQVKDHVSILLRIISFLPIFPYSFLFYFCRRPNPWWLPLPLVRGGLACLSILLNSNPNSHLTRKFNARKADAPFGLDSSESPGFLFRSRYQTNGASTISPPLYRACARNCMLAS